MSGGALAGLRMLAVIVFIAAAMVARASDVGGCKTIKAKEGRVYLIRAALYNGTHITLPERLMLDPIPGNNALWKHAAATSSTIITMMMTTITMTITTMTTTTTTISRPSWSNAPTAWILG